MNIDRIIRVASCFLFLTGFQIYWYDRRKFRYCLTFGGILYYLVLGVWYLICFCHHFENSAFLKLVKDLSPFVYRLIFLQVLFGLKVLIIQIFESKNLGKISNSLIQTFPEEKKSLKNFDTTEVLVYLMLFATLLITIAIGLYIAIELEFEPPPLDHIMVYMALFMPHFTLAGCLRLHTLSLCLTKRELVNLRTSFKTADQLIYPQQLSIALEVCNSATIYKNVSKRLDTLAEFFKLFDSVLQRQLLLLVGLNLNCLLFGVYCCFNYENTWKVLVSARNQRIFYAATSGIFVCILTDYAILLFSCLSFCRVKRNLYNLIEAQLFESNRNGLEMPSNLKIILYKLSKKLNLKLFGFVEFKIWNFVVFQGLLGLIIALIVSHHCLGNQIKLLNEQLDAYESAD